LVILRSNLVSSIPNSLIHNPNMAYLMNLHKIAMYCMETLDQSIFVQDGFITIIIFIIIFLNMHSLDHFPYPNLLIPNLNSFIEMDHVLEVMSQMMQHHPLNQLILNHHLHHHHHRHFHHHHHHHYLHNFMVFLLGFFNSKLK
jgi:hypothetical protein